MLPYLSRLTLWLVLLNLLILSLVLQISSLWQSAVIAYTAQASPDSVEMEIRAIDSRTGVIAVLVRADSILSFSVSADKEWLVYDQRATGISNIRRVQIRTGHEESLLWGNFSDPQYSPDGQWLAYASLEDVGRGIWLLPTSGGGVARQIIAPHRSYVWTADSQAIWYIDVRIFQRSEQVVYAYHLLTETEQRIDLNLLQSSAALTSLHQLTPLGVEALYRYDLMSQSLHQVNHNSSYRPVWRGDEIAFIQAGQLVIMSEYGTIQQRLKLPNLAFTGRIAWLN